MITHTTKKRQELAAKGKCIFFLLCFFLFYNPADATSQQKSDYGIEALAYAYQDSIALRWAPNSALAWELLNQYGYYIQRITLTKNGKLQQDRQEINLFNAPLKPNPLAAWEQEIDADNFMDIAAQAIYGESFELTDNYSSDIMQVVNKSKENEQRFSFALFAADMSKQVAKWSALSYVDLKAEEDEGYLYKIYGAVPESIMKIDTAYVFVKLQDYKPLPQPRYFEGKVSDRNVMLSWENNTNNNIYVAYKLERAINEPINFKSVTELPIINTAQKENVGNGKAFKMDSLPEDNTPYYYRVRGLTSFGDEGPASDTIKVIATSPIKAVASITYYSVDATNNQVKLGWEYPATEEKVLKGFNILRSRTTDSGYIKINGTLLSPSVREFIDPAPGNTNYYKLEMQGIYGAQKQSFPHLIQLEDSIPPDIPENLAANIDSTGIVTLTWKENKELDLLGYKVYKANFSNAEFSEITSKPTVNNVFEDKISITSLSDKVYYKIVALDNRFNPSDFSLPIEVRKPDIIPPVAPQISFINSTEQGVSINWDRSSSYDVVAHLIYRKQKDGKDWLLIETINDDTQSFIDTNTEPGHEYYYKIESKDVNGLQSVSGKPIYVVSSASSASEALFEVKVKADKGLRSVQLLLEFKNDIPKKLLIYKGTTVEAPSLYKQINGGNKFFEDKNLTLGTEYIYRIQAIYTDGKTARFSEEINVKL